MGFWALYPMANPGPFIFWWLKITEEKLCKRVKVSEAYNLPILYYYMWYLKEIRYNYLIKDTEKIRNVNLVTINIIKIFIPYEIQISLLK